jgi:hypothetical protein
LARLVERSPEATASCTLRTLWPPDELRPSMVTSATQSSVPAPDGTGAIRAFVPRFALLAPLRARKFALLFGGNAVSLAGDQVQLVALAVLVLDLTGSTAVLGAVLGAQAVPRAVLMLVGGVAADRFHPRTVMLGANVVQGLLVLALTAVLAVGRLAEWHLYAYALASGIALAFSIPAAQALVPALVPTGQLRSANALTSLNFNLASSVFPPLAGVLVARAGSVPAFAFNALSFFVAAGAVLAIGGERVPALRTGGAIAQLREGIAVARADRVVWAAIVAATVFSLGFGGATLVGLPALATLELDAGTEGLGVLLGAAGIGAILGSVVMGSIPTLTRQGLAAAVTLLALGVTLALVAGAPNVAVAAPVLVLSGFLRGVCANLYVTLVQSRAPAAARGRVMSLFFLGVNGLAPLSLAAGGLLGDAFGPRILLVTGGAVIALAGAYALAQPDFRRA